MQVKQPFSHKIITLCLLLLICICLCGAKNTSSSGNATLLVGVSKYDMTPQADRTLGGYGTGYICDVDEDILDPVYLRVLVIQKENDPNNRLLFLAPDMCTFEDNDDDSVFLPGTLELFADAADVSVDQVYVVPTHTHQGPEHFNHDPVTEPEQYADDQRIINGFLDSITEAVDNMQPVNIGVVSSRNDLAVNRRPNYVVAYDLPYDNRVLGLKFTSTVDDTPVAFLTNYSCHQTALGNEKPENSNLVTTEIIGWGMNTIEEEYCDINPDFVSVFINGFYGAAGPDIYGEKNADYETMKRRGIEFGEEILQDFEATETGPFSGNISYTTETIIVDTTMEDLPTYPLHLRAAQIGDDLGFFGVDLECFAGMGAMIRALSPYDNTLIAANCSGFTTYGPTYDAAHDGIGGPEVTERTVFQDTTMEKVLTAAEIMFKRLKNDGLYEYTIAAATSSESNPYHDPSMAFDGNTHSKWFGNGSSEVWLQADLGESKAISKVVLNFGDYSRLEAGKDYSVLVSNDPAFTTYTTVAEDTNNSTSIMAYRFESVNGRYVRFVCTDAYGDDNNFYPAVYEMNIYGTQEDDGQKLTAVTVSAPENSLFSETFENDLSAWTGDPLSAEIVNGKMMLTDNTTHMFRTVENSWENYRFEADIMPSYNCYFGLLFRVQDSEDAYLWQFTTETLAFVCRKDGEWNQLKPYIELPIRLQADTASDIMRHITVDVCGGTIKTYIDGVLIDTTTDFSLLSGGIGFWTNGTIAIDNVCISEIPPLLSDQFDTLDNWELTNTSGSAGISQNTLTLNTNDAIQSVNGAQWENYTFEFDAALEVYSGASFRLQENGDDYLWWIGNDGPQIIKRINNGWEVIGTQYISGLDTATEHHVSILAASNKLQVWVDNTLCNEAIDNTLATGRVGLFVGANSVTYQNVFVRPLGAITPTIPEGTLLQDYFTGSLSQWAYSGASVSDGVLTLSANGNLTSNDGSSWDNYTLELDLNCNNAVYHGATFRVQDNGDNYLWWIGNNGPVLVKRIGTGWVEFGTQYISTLDLSQSMHVSIQIDGSDIKVFVNGNLCNSAIDSTLLNGRVGFFSGSGNMMLSNVVVKEYDGQYTLGDVLLEDSFSNDLDNWLSNLAVIDNGQLVLGTSGGGVLNAYATSNNGSNWGNYIVEFDADFKNCYYRGLSFRCQSNGDDYLWWFGDENLGVQIVKRVDGNWQIVSNTQAAIALNGMHHFKLVVNGANFYTYVDNVLYNSGFDAELLTGGIMLYVNYDEVRVDNLTVTEIE